MHTELLDLKDLNLLSIGIQYANSEVLLPYQSETICLKLMLYTMRTQSKNNEKNEGKKTIVPQVL